MGASSRRKGREWESRLAAWLQANGWPHAEMRSAGMAGSPDILGLPYTIECKNRKDVASAICEGLDAAIEANRGPSLPVVIVKRPRHRDVGDAYAVMRLADWNTLAVDLENEAAS